MVVGKRGGLGGQATARRGPGIEKMVIKPNYRNVSVFTFLQNGCFEREHLSFCPARISGFSCVHWIDPDSSRRSDNRTAGACPIGNYPVTDVINAVASVAVPVLIVVCVPLLVAATYATRRAGISLLHFCLYLTLMSLFDLLELLMLSTNALGRAFFAVDFLDSVTLMSRTACVVVTLMINSLRHLQSAFLITLAVDTWRFARQPVKVNRTLRSEWVKNCSILMTTTCLFVNCQYFWTFDVSEHDNRILHGRMVSKAYECSYAINLLSLAYTSFVWPLIDIGLGNVLPTLACFLFASWAMHLIRGRRRRCGGNTAGMSLLSLYQSHFIDVSFVFQVLGAAAVICLCCGVLALPETVYVLWKFVKFTDAKHSATFASRVGTRLATAASGPSSGPTPAEEMWRSVEPYHQVIDACVLYCRLLTILLKPMVLFLKVRRFREEVVAFVRRRARSVGKQISP